MTRKLADDWRPSKRQHYWKQPEYWEESWRLEETCCHSNFCEKTSANADVKNSKGVNYTTRPSVNKQEKICYLINSVSVDHRVKIKESEKNRQIIGTCQRALKAGEHKGDSDTICSSYTWNSSQRIGKKTGGIGCQRKDENHTDLQPHTSSRTLRRVQEPWEDLCLLDSCEKLVRSEVKIIYIHTHIHIYIYIYIYIYI